MKRSSHVALLVGGLSVAGVGAYAMIPPRQDCRPASPAPGAAITPGTPGTSVVVTDGKPAVAPPLAGQPQNCRTTRWFGSSGSTTGSGYRRSGGVFVPGWSTRTDRSSGSVGVAPSRQSTRARSTTSGRSTTSSSSRSTTTSRGGFGSTGRSAGRSSS